MTRLSLLILIAMPGCRLILGPPDRGGSKSSSDGSDLVRQDIDADAHPKALCNDGTVPVYYHRAGTGNGADKWIVFLKGGGACGDELTCTRRGSALTSNKTWLKQDTLGGDEIKGILSSTESKNPDFHKWNHVYVPYCSSDFWTGDRVASKSTFDMHFRGTRIIDAVIDALKVESAEELILAGSSAGAVGVVHSIDRVAKSLPNVRVGGLADAGFNPDAEVDYGVLADLWSPRVDASCDKQLDDTAKCLEGFVLLQEGEVKTTTFVQQSQLDPNLVGGLEEGNASDEQAAERLWSDLREVMGQQDGAFCPAEPVHMTVTSKSFTSLTIDGVTLADAVGRWWFDRSGAKRLIEPDCDLGDVLNLKDRLGR